MILFPAPSINNKDNNVFYSEHQKGNYCIITWLTSRGSKQILCLIFALEKDNWEPILWEQQSLLYWFLDESTMELKR